MKKLFSTTLFSFLAFFLVATIAPVAGGNDAQAADGLCVTVSTPNSAKCSAYDGTDSTQCEAIGGCKYVSDECIRDETHTSTSAACASNETSTDCAPDIWCTWRVKADADNNAFVDTLCNILKIVTGNGGKAFAAFAIISLGIGFFTGKVSWGLMIGVAAGIAAMFGAPTIVAAISGKSAFTCDVDTATGRI